MIRPGHLIKHTKFMDVCFEVVSVFNVGHKLKIKGYWVNMGFVESYYVFPTFSRIVIMKEDLQNWKIGYNNDGKCHRNNHWRDA